MRPLGWRHLYLWTPPTPMAPPFAPLSNAAAAAASRAAGAAAGADAGATGAATAPTAAAAATDLTDTGGAAKTSNGRTLRRGWLGGANGGGGEIMGVVAEVAKGSARTSPGRTAVTARATLSAPMVLRAPGNHEHCRPFGRYRRRWRRQRRQRRPHGRRCRRSTSGIGGDVMKLNGSFVAGCTVAVFSNTPQVTSGGGSVAWKLSPTIDATRCEVRWHDVVRFQQHGSAMEMDSCTYLRIRERVSRTNIHQVLQRHGKRPVLMLQTCGPQACWSERYPWWPIVRRSWRGEAQSVQASRGRHGLSLRGLKSP